MHQPGGFQPEFLLGIDSVICAVIAGAGGKSRPVVCAAGRGAQDARGGESRQASVGLVRLHAQEPDEDTWLCDLSDRGARDSVPGSAIPE